MAVSKRKRSQKWEYLQDRYRMMPDVMPCGHWIAYYVGNLCGQCGTYYREDEVLYQEPTQLKLWI